jgi:hypothetical protein
MPNDPKEDEIPIEIWCDLLEKELETALDDLMTLPRSAGKVAERKKRYRHSAQGRSWQCSALLE